MLGLLKGVLRIALVAWIATMAAALATAVQRKREAESAVPPGPQDDDIRLLAVFEPFDFTSEASAFRGGVVECRFGGGVLDLRGATLDPAGATLHTTAVFGGGQIVVPDDWRVTLDVRAIFGGVGDARPVKGHREDAPHLRVEGFALFGGWGITAERAQEAMPEPEPAPV